MTDPISPARLLLNETEKEWDRIKQLAITAELAYDEAMQLYTLAAATYEKELYEGGWVRGLKQMVTIRTAEPGTDLFKAKRTEVQAKSRWLRAKAWEGTVRNVVWRSQH